MARPRLQTEQIPSSKTHVKGVLRVLASEQKLAPPRATSNLHVNCSVARDDISIRILHSGSDSRHSAL